MVLPMLSGYKYYLLQNMKAENLNRRGGYMREFIIILYLLVESFYFIDTGIKRSLVTLTPNLSWKDLTPQEDDSLKDIYPYVDLVFKAYFGGKLDDLWLFLESFCVNGFVRDEKTSLSAISLDYDSLGILQEDLDAKDFLKQVAEKKI